MGESRRILIVETQRLLCECVGNLLQSQPHLEIVAKADRVDTMLRMTLEDEPDTIVTDYMRDSVEGTQLLLRELPDTRVIVLTEHMHAPVVSAMLRAGALGFVAKDFGFTELMNAIAAASKGRVYLCPRAKKEVIGDYIRVHHLTHRRSSRALTPQEQDLIRLIGDGKTSKEIGLAMQLSAKSVDAHRRRLMKMLGLPTVAALVKYSICHHYTVL